MGRHDFFSKYAPRPGRVRFAISRVAVLGLVMIVLGWIGISILLAPPPSSEPLAAIPLESEPSNPSAPAGSPAGPTGQPGPLVTVHVVGAVQKPGVYKLPEGSRITDAVKKAGGLAKDAHPELVNLAAKLVDGQQVILPGGSSLATGQNAPAPTAKAKISISAADAQTLQELPGIGPALAERIIDFRTENGPFTSVEELDAVSGIGPAMLEKLTELVVP